MVSIRIAIFDDNADFVRKETKLVHEILKDEAHMVDCFVDGKSFFSNRPFFEYDLLLMDIMLTEGENGIKLSEEILRNNPTIQIIFVSGYRSFMESAYEVPHVWYILKQKLSEMLPKALERVKENLIQLKKERIELINNGKRSYILCKDVCYIEQDKRKLLYHTKDGIYDEYGKLDDKMSALPNKIFIRCHKSYAINKDYVAEYQRTDAKMNDGNPIPISRSYIENLIKAFEK